MGIERFGVRIFYAVVKKKIMWFVFQMSSGRKRRKSTSSDVEEVVAGGEEHGDEIEEGAIHVAERKSRERDEEVAKERRRTWAYLIHLAEKWYPEDYAVMTSSTGPLIGAFRCLSIAEEDSKQFLFAELSRLQHHILPPKESEFDLEMWRKLSRCVCVGE